MAADWTNHEIRLLQKYASVMPYRQIAAIIGRTENSVRVKANRIGVQGRQWPVTLIDMESVMDLIMTGETITGIAERLGMSRKTIGIHISRLPKKYRDMARKNADRRRSSAMQKGRRKGSETRIAA